MITCQCPAATTLPDSPVVTCSERFGQIQKIIFQRIWKTVTSGGTTTTSKNSIPDGSSANQAGKYTTWTGLKAKTSSDTDKDAKITVTPFVEEPTDDGGDARTVGGGNASLNGIETIIGSNPINFSCKLNNVPQDVVATLKSLMCECMGNNLGVFLINEQGLIEGIKDSGSWYPIPIQKLFIGDKHHGGLEGNDYNDLQFAFAPDYSDKLDILTLDESALSL